MILVKVGGRWINCAQVVSIERAPDSHIWVMTDGARIEVTLAVSQPVIERFRLRLAGTAG